MQIPDLDSSYFHISSNFYFCSLKRIVRILSAFFCIAVFVFFLKKDILSRTMKTEILFPHIFNVISFNLISKTYLTLQYL
jgi:hypothetical protein